MNKLKGPKAIRAADHIGEVAENMGTWKIPVCWWLPFKAGDRQVSQTNRNGCQGRTGDHYYTDLAKDWERKP